jgi:hypothetical protein
MGMFERIFRRFLPASAVPWRRPRSNRRRPAQIERILPDPEAKKLPIAELERLTMQIPSMGGTELGAQLRDAARRAPSNTSIVEVGSWLGAGTAQLALGLREREQAGSVDIHCYDRWEANDPEVEKAARMKNLSLHAGQDTLPWVMDTLRPFGVPIRFTKVDLRNATWDGGPISIYIDDAAKTPSKFLHVLRTFGPHWIPGVTLVVLMDFHFWKKTGLDKHKAQMRFLEIYQDHFEPVEGFQVDTNDAFRYKKPIDFRRVTSELLGEGD